MQFNAKHKRVDKIDFLRFLGLSLIILAHVQPPGWLAQLRNFDVPLMFIVMGMSFKLNEHKYTSKWKYISSRFKRLVIPTWLFFLFFFLINQSIGCILQDQRLTYSAGHIITSFTLSSGLGYVWVIRLFFLVSMLAILLPKRFLNPDFAILFVILVFVVIVNSYLLSGWSTKIDLLSKYFLPGFLISNVIPYFLIFIVGYKMDDFSLRQIILLIAGSALVFLSISIFKYTNEHHFIYTQLDKYPPGIYYLSYAILCCVCVFAASERLSKTLTLLRLWPFVSFVSGNSIWIYLWHIPFIILTVKMHAEYYLSYFIVYVISLICVYLQVKIVKRIARNIVSDKLKMNLIAICTG